MKILASPFESAREPAALEAGERARLDQAAAVSDVKPPAATTEIRPGIDSATRESLSRLALLIRNQLKAVESAEGEGVPEPDGRREHGRDPDGGKQDDQGEKQDKRIKAMVLAGTGELVSPSVAPDSFPSIVRLERRFKQAARDRGSRIYSQQKNKDAVQLILTELERRHAHIPLENAHELLIPITSSTRRAA